MSQRQYPRGPDDHRRNQTDCHRRRHSLPGTARRPFRAVVGLRTGAEQRRQRADSPHGQGIYQRYVELTYLQPHYAIPCFLAVFILLVYILGKFMAAGIGGFLGDRFDLAIQRLPLVRSVYKAVKQVCDFFFSEKQIQFKRVVAVEFPRPGMWSIAFVTSDGLGDIRAAANDAVLGVFIPSSPMPVSGYSLTVLKREAIDLNITIEEAIQYLVSCGLVMPQKDLERLKATGLMKPESSFRHSRQPVGPVASQLGDGATSPTRPGNRTDPDHDQRRPAADRAAARSPARAFSRKRSNANCSTGGSIWRSTA